MAHRHNRRRVRSRSRKQNNISNGLEQSYHMAITNASSSGLQQSLPLPPSASIALTSNGVNTFCHSHASSLSSTASSTSSFRPTRILARPSRTSEPAVPVSTSMSNVISPAASLMSNLQTTYAPLPPSASSFDAVGPTQSTFRLNALTVNHAGPAAERKAAMIEAERLRLFGGVPGDDEGLCYKMLEVFGSLDYMR